MKYTLRTLLSLALLCLVAAPKLLAQEAPKLPTLFIVGDSTLKSSAPLRGWGQEIGEFFDPAKIKVDNRAIGGRSSRTFQTEGRWDAVLADLKPGDMNFPVASHRVSFS
jgi:rhamnogalacturonan acetylesterase